MRKCFICQEPILECMGFVIAGDFLLAVSGKLPFKKVRELCGKCGVKKLLSNKGEKMMSKPPLFKKPAGKPNRNWNNTGAGTDGDVVCGLCGKYWKCEDNQNLTYGRFLGREFIIECCGKVFDVVYAELGEEIVREFLEDFSKDPTNSRFTMFLKYYLPEAIKRARATAEEILKKTDIEKDVKKLQGEKTDH